MIEKVIKRDGREVGFNRDKIFNAIFMAFKESGEIGEDDYKIIENITNEISNMNKLSMTVEEIQDIVEKKLMSTKRKDVAKAYILYRNERTKARERNSELTRSISEKIEAKNVQHQNANVDEYSFGGRMGSATSEVMKDYAMKYCMSEMAVKNHKDNIIYEHDLDHYPVGDHNCMSIPFDDLLANGFNTRQTDVRPAQSVNTAFQLLAVIFQLQSLQQFGGVASTHLDWTMIPYVKKSFYKHYVASYLKSKGAFLECDLMEMLFDTYEDEVGVVRNKFDDWVEENKPLFESETGLSAKDVTFNNKDNLDKIHYQSALYDTIVETYQAVEGMYHNLNTLQSRSGNQLPFTSINYGTCTELEGRLVTKAILDISIKGIGKLHKTAIFPCGIFQCMKGVNRKKGEPNYDLYRLALKSTSLRLYPNYANVDWSNNKGYDINDPRTYFSTMGCRTANLMDINGLGQLKDGRGNICPVTIILPTVAMMAKEGLETVTYPDGYSEQLLIDTFMKLLDRKIGEARDMLIERYNYICSQSPESAKFMYENNVIAGYDGEHIESALKHGTIVIGQLGLAEALQLLIGCDHTMAKGMELAKKIEQLFKDRCAEYKQEYKLNFGVYYTPAENLCYTAMQKFKERYGVIENVSDREFFTNSMHVPVWKKISPFDKIDIESQLTGYSSAGCITYVELDGGVKNNIDALEQIVNYAMDKDVPYFAVNVPNDTCLDCGFTGEFNGECPVCGSKNVQQLRRVTGYLTGNYTTAFNKGKQQEVEMRVKHQ